MSKTIILIACAAAMSWAVPAELVERGGTLTFKSSDDTMLVLADGGGTDVNLAGLREGSCVFSVYDAASGELLASYDVVIQAAAPAEDSVEATNVEPEAEASPELNLPPAEPAHEANDDPTTPAPAEDPIASSWATPEAAAPAGDSGSDSGSGE